MTRFYFDLHECGHGTVTDHDGVELPDLAAAKDYAVDYARRTRAEEVRFGRLCLGCAIAVRDETGATILALPFAEAVSITLTATC